MNNVYYVGSGELTFDLIERIINENLKLELAPEAKLRIQKCRDYLDKKIAESRIRKWSSLPSMRMSQQSLPPLSQFASLTYLQMQWSATSQSTIPSV